MILAPKDSVKNPTEFARIVLINGEEQFVVGWGSPTDSKVRVGLTCSESPNSRMHGLSDMMEIKNNKSGHFHDSDFYLKDNPTEPRKCQWMSWTQIPNPQEGYGIKSFNMFSIPRTVRDPVTGADKFINSGAVEDIVEFKWLTSDEMNTLLESKKTALVKQSEDIANKLNQAIESQQVLDTEKIAARNQEATLFRKIIKSGDDSHCGLVIEVKKPIVKVQTMAGEKWLKLTQIYPAGGASCRFVNGVYQEVY